MSNTFLFSVVIPVYNVADYLAETIESVIRQDIGFKDNIQIILVNDGSTDGGDAICKEYAARYPHNIIYVDQQNQGVSAARNLGMQYVAGKYVNFLDGDNKWDASAFSVVKAFFESHSDMHFVSCRMKLFDALDNYHALDYKFSSDRVVNILNDYNCIQLHITSSFIASDLLTQYRFNPALQYEEDAEFITNLLLREKQYGLLRSAVHYYRKREDQSSAIQTKEHSIKWYKDTITLFYDHIVQQSLELYNEVIPYVQYLLAYDIKWRIKKQMPDFLPDEVKDAYKRKIVSLLQIIDDRYICEQKQLSAQHKAYALSLKYGYDVRNDIILKKKRFCYNGVPVCSLNNNKQFRIDILDIDKKKLHLAGQVTLFLRPDQYNCILKPIPGSGTGCGCFQQKV